MDFSLTPFQQELITKTRAFVDQEIIPLELDAKNYDDHENINLGVLKKVQAKAKAAGLWSPQMPQSLGGMGLSHVEWTFFYEEANRSIFGPVCFNCSAPDDGNMNLLSKVATPTQQKRWLMPIISGEVRSSFVMTEPHPGGGSDPTMMITYAKRENNKWKLYGHKWFITGAGIAEHFIVLARTSDDKRKGLTAFLIDRAQKGLTIGRRIPIMGPEEHGGHCEMFFDGVEVEDENVLMNVGDGFKATQIRLGPARLTHCMRWLGLSRKALSLTRNYISERESFGIKLEARESVQMKLGQVASQIRIGKLLVLHAAYKLDQGDRAKAEVSLAKNHVAETLHQAADLAIQLQGAKGYSKDTLAEWIYRYARQARLVDGASEVHQMVIANEFLSKNDSFFYW